MEYAAIYIILFLIIVPSIVFLIILVKKYKSPESRGKRGEQAVTDMLIEIQNIYGGHIINDVIVPTNKGTTQIDHIYFSNKGIFVIETKNYSGRIYGDDYQTYWTQVLAYGKTKNKLYNPLKQNEAHVNAIRRLLWSSIIIVPMVIFVKGNTSFIRSDRVHSLSEARHYIINADIKSNKEEVEKAYQRIVEFKNKPIISEEEHIRNVKAKH